MGGKSIGTMANRIYIIAANGGRRQPGPRCYEEVSCMYRMLEQLKNGELDGFLLDRYTFWEWTTMLDEYEMKSNFSTCDDIKKFEIKKCLKMLPRGHRTPHHGVYRSCHSCYPLHYKQCRGSLVEYFHKLTVQQDIPHTGGEAAYGVWMKKRSHYDFFRHGFENNKMTFKSLLASEYTNQQGEDEEDAFMWQLYGDLSHYRYLYICLGCQLALIVLFGCGYELLQRRRRKKKDEKISMASNVFDEENC